MGEVSILKQRLYILFRENRANASLAVEQAIGQLTFSRLEFIHFFLDRAHGHQPVDENRLVLPDAMGAVDRLLLDGRIPPGIEHDHGIRRCQVEAHATGLQADQENVGCAALKPVDDALAIPGFSGQQTVADTAGFEAGAD